jgi:hypothetical protein
MVDKVHFIKWSTCHGKYHIHIRDRNYMVDYNTIIKNSAILAVEN